MSGISGRFTREEALSALRHLKEKGEEGASQAGIFRSGWFGKKAINAEEAYERLSKGEDVLVPNRAQDYHEMKSLEDLALLDDLYGRQTGTGVPKEDAAAIRSLEAGKDGNDGIYKGRFLIGDKKVDGYDGVKLLQEGTELNVKIGEDDQNTVRSTQDLRELDAFQGSGRNTILPQPEFDAMIGFEKAGTWQIHGEVENQKAFDALQAMQAGQSVGVQSRGREAAVRSPEDAAELAALEGKGQRPSSLDEATQDRLKHFESTAKDGKAFSVGYGYEALQSLQAGRAVGVQAGGALNSVATPEDLRILDALLGRKAEQLLPEAQSQALQSLVDGPGQEGIYVGGARQNVYGAYQGIRQGRTPEYRFPGGDFAETLSVPIGSFDEVETARTKVANQKEYDRYRYSLPEFVSRYTPASQGLSRGVGQQFDGARGGFESAGRAAEGIEQKGSEVERAAGGIAPRTQDIVRDLRRATDPRELDGAARAADRNLQDLRDANRSMDFFQREVGEMGTRMGEVRKQVSALGQAVEQAIRAATPPPAQPGAPPPVDKRPEWAPLKNAVDAARAALKTAEDTSGRLKATADEAGPTFKGAETALDGTSRALGRLRDRGPEFERAFERLSADSKNLSDSARNWTRGASDTKAKVADTASALGALAASPSSDSAAFGPVREKARGAEEAFGTLDAAVQTAFRSLEGAGRTVGELRTALGEVRGEVKKGSDALAGLSKKQGDLQSRMRGLERDASDSVRAFDDLDRALQNVMAAIRAHAPASHLESSCRQASDSLRDARRSAERCGGSDARNLEASVSRFFSGLLEVDRAASRVSSDLERIDRDAADLAGNLGKAQTQAKESSASSQTGRNQVAAARATVEALPPMLQSVEKLSAAPGIDPAELGDLRSTARDLSSRAPKGSELARVAQRIETLVGNQLDRPERPAGWEPPFPRVQQ